MLSKDESEKAKLKYLLSKEGAGELKELRNKYYCTYADLFKMFPSAFPPLNYLIEYMPKIKQRLYSIASSNEHIGDKIELCII